MKLYKPQIIKKEIDDTHYYYVNGKFVPGVTTILHEAMPMPYNLRQWIGDVGNEKAEAKLKKAGDRGTAIHNACEALLKGATIDLDKEFPERRDKKALVSFVNWVAEFQPEVKEIEFTVASQHGFAGTLDLFCLIQKEPWIIDFKTSSGVYDSHKLQVAGAYKQAFYEMTGIKAKTAILHLNPRTKKGWTWHNDLKIGKKPVDIDDFLKVFEAYKVYNGGVIPEPNLTDVYPEKLVLQKEEMSPSSSVSTSPTAGTMPTAV